MNQTSSSIPPPKSSCANAIFDRIWDLDFNRQVPTPDYPPISSIPRTSPARLQRATPKQCPDKHIRSSSPEANDFLYDHTSSAPTVLYLAYGSNLCAQTFLGQRGIRPISAVNVSAPSLRLTFDLPGVPYQEPCFANTAPRKVPKLPKPPTLPPGFDPPQYLFPPASSELGKTTDAQHGDPAWDMGLIGVVYEVTPEDYATIVKTEGGGSSYQDILYYAQPSARYLKLIMDGAAEHGLPDDYQAWLARLQPYTITTHRQSIGQYLLVGLVFPIVGLLLVLSRWLADDRGKIPAWLGLTLETVFHLIWLAYDGVFKPVFGDGERTEDEEEKRRRWAARRVLRKRKSPNSGGDEEKTRLLNG
ncbi:hypothetical protein VMCG_10406 [Cytospora schulzeri]|uniref:gamma-glutamylcyclotransferase n=1 Tax=Cytospora schulzeri TaxID=448051 RepID=A0A423VAS4_9PEZI|nr:hypothetical protein VMCG_10406 [Valsa malicola]